MSKTHYGFRTGRLPLRPQGNPILPVLFVLAAVAAWIWALAPRQAEQAALSQPSITQSPAPVKEEIASPAPLQLQTITAEPVTLYAVQLSAHEDEASALGAQQALLSLGLYSSPYPMENGSWKLLDSLHPNQEAADARKEALSATGRETYVFTWEIPAFQVELNTTQEEIDLWQHSLTLLHHAALAPSWAGQDSAGFTAQGLAASLTRCAQGMNSAQDPQLQNLASTLISCASILERSTPESQRATDCALEVSRYVRSVLQTS